MNEPESFTGQQASDPATPGQVLADIAALRPDLRPAVAANPSAYPGLLAWLGGLGEPAVDAALQARAAASATPAAPSVPTVPTAPPGYAQPGGGQDAAGGYKAPGGYGAPAGTGGYGAPTAPAGYVPPSGSGGYPAQTGPGGYPAPATAYGYGYQPTGPGPTSGGSSRKVLWIVLGVVLGVIVLGVVGVIVVRGLVTSVIPDAYGSDAELDALYDECANEDWAACDQLFFDSPTGSDYEEFADTCGHRTDGGSYCADELGGAATSSSGSYGDDPTLDALWDACEAGDGQACDDLYSSSPLGSEYEEFADTCGHRTDGGTYCVDELG